MDATTTTTHQFMAVAREWGPWIALVVVFVSSQIAMVWFLLSQTKAREKRMGERLDQQSDMIQNTMLAAMKETSAALNASALAQQSMSGTVEASRLTMVQCIEVLREHNQLKRMELELRQKQGAA